MFLKKPNWLYLHCLDDKSSHERRHAPRHIC